MITASQSLERHFTQALLLRAWEAVAAKASAPGIDEVTVPMFARQAQQRIERLHETLISGTYAPQPAVTFPKRKDDSAGMRMLAILTVRDRIAARAGAQMLMHHHNEGLQPQSYAYRPRKGATKAVTVVERHLRDSSHAVRIDIADFFDSIDYDLLGKTLLQLGEPDEVVELLLRCARIRRFDGVEVRTPERGVPQGSPLAPVLSNLYLDSLDRELNHHHFRFIRYADDLLILARDADEASHAYRVTQRSLDALHLELSTAKSRVSSVDDGFVFLGFLFNRNGKTPCREACERLSRKMSEAYSDEDDQELTARRNAVLRGWTNYFGEEAAENVLNRPFVEKTESAAPQVVLDVPSAKSNPAQQTTSQKHPRQGLAETDQGTEILPEEDSRTAETPETERINAETDRQRPTATEETHSSETPKSAEDEESAEAQAQAPVESTAAENLAECRELFSSGRFQQASQTVRRVLADDEAVLSKSESREATGLLADIYERQGLHGAAAKCRRSAGIDEKKAADHEDLEPPFGAKDVEKWLEVFGASTQPAYRQFIDRLGRHGYRPASRALNAEYLRDHWRGRHTVAVPVFIDKERVPFGCVDLDITRSTLDTLKAEQIEQKREEILRDAVHILDTAHRAGVEGVLEDSGYKGYHVWFFFFAPLNATHVRRFLIELQRVAGPPPDGTHRELFPGSDSPKPDSVGMRIKVPMGTHRLSGRRSAFLAPDGKQCDLHEQLTRLSVRTNGRALYQAVGHWQTAAPGQAEQPANASKQEKTASTSQNRIENLYEHCAVLRALRKKATEHHELTHYERSVVRGILNPLGDDGRKEIHRLIGNCANYSPSTTNKMLADTKAHRPMGCRRIREILDSMCADLPCHCRFKPKKNDYAHPLRHLDTNGGSGKNSKSGAARNSSKPTPRDGNSGSSPPQQPDDAEESEPHGDDEDIIALIKTYRETRRKLLETQQQIEAALDDNPSLALAFGDLKSDGADPDIKHWIIEL